MNLQLINDSSLILTKSSAASLMALTASTMTSGMTVVSGESEDI